MLRFVIICVWCISSLLLFGCQYQCNRLDLSLKWPVLCRVATSMAVTAHLDVTNRRHWTQRWQSVEYCQWPWSLQGATTHRWSSGLVSEWVCRVGLLTHSLAHFKAVRCTGWAKKPDCFLKVCNSRICWHRIAFYIPNCSVSYPE